MENIGSYEKLSQRNRDLEILTRIIQSVHKSYNLEEVYLRFGYGVRKCRYGNGLFNR